MPESPKNVKHHKTKGRAVAPVSKIDQEIELQRRKFVQMGYEDEDAQYLAESKVLPRFYVTPATDLKKERQEALLKEMVLQSLAEKYTIRAALKEWTITRAQWERWMAEDNAFRVAVGQVELDIGDQLEEEAFTRVMGGSGTDALLTTMLKAHKPDKYKDRKELTGADGAPLMAIEGAQAQLRSKLMAVIARVEATSEQQIPG